MQIFLPCIIMGHKIKRTGTKPRKAEHISGIISDIGRIQLQTSSEIDWVMLSETRISKRGKKMRKYGEWPIVSILWVTNPISHLCYDYTLLERNWVEMLMISWFTFCQNLFTFLCSLRNSSQAPELRRSRMRGNHNHISSLRSLLCVPVAGAREASSAECTIITAKVFQGLQMSWGHQFSSFQNIKTITAVGKFWRVVLLKITNKKNLPKKPQTKIKLSYKGNFKFRQSNYF